MLFAIALRIDRLGLLRWAGRAWIVGGVVFVLFEAMNFYTHIGMYDNIANGTMIKWRPCPTGQPDLGVTSPDW